MMAFDKILEVLAGASARVLASLVLACLAAFRFPRDWWMDGLYRGILGWLAVFGTALLVFTLFKQVFDWIFTWRDNARYDLNLIRNLRIPEREVLAAFVVQNETVLLCQDRSAMATLVVLELLVETEGRHADLYELSTRAKAIFKRTGARGALKGATGQIFKERSDQIKARLVRDRERIDIPGVGKASRV